jgi:2-keto-4-pentenoate hydratase/2-oxohepta-3-ene-1,7-dioic acid hydratase in catechol pathway
MRLVTIRQHGSEHPGAVLRAADGTDRVLDLSTRVGCRGVEVLLSNDRLRAEVESAMAANDPQSLPLLSSVRLGPPVRPDKILCLGYNYRGHLETVAGDDPEHPNVFVKTPNVICGPDDPVTIRACTPQVDYEGEIAVVIGRTAHRVSEAEALDHVAGYTLFNDVSDRDWQSRTNQWALGKSVDGFGPLGPWLVTPDEFGELPGRTVEVQRNGDVTVQASTDAMVFGVPFLIHYLSQVITLEPGDVISTGTPARSDAAQAVHQPLSSGDVVAVRVTGLGELTTTFISEEENA